MSGPLRESPAPSSSWMWIPAAAISTSGYATTYLSVEQAQAAMFPGDPLTRAFVTLTREQTDAIEKKCGVKVSQREVQLWKSAAGGCFMLDEVAGSHEVLSIAVGLNSDGSLRQIEILDYQESYGGEAGDHARWQSSGRQPSTAGLRLTADIKNISRATLSCWHVTDAVKRLLATYHVAIKQP